MLSAIIACGGMYAAPVSPERAMKIAGEFAGRAVSSRTMQKAPADARLTLAHTQKAAESGDALYYVFNRGRNAGYVLVAGDDRLPEVIGFSSTGSFDYASVPDNMKGMIRSWDAQIAWLLAHPEARALAPRKPEKAIAPLLGEIMWDQGDPYNRKCPSVTQYDMWGDATGKGPAATGCVATAIGQIMYYHQWPETGKGSVSYTSKGEDDTVSVSVNFEGHKYDWGKMLPTLTATSPDDAVNEVSTLLYHVGAAFESVYGASTGATDVSVAPALKKYFSYDNGVSYLIRDFYSEQEWTDLLFTEFENSRPVAYGGLTKKWEGHFFVLDGVNEDGYFHVNWGWSGMEDGYYLLSLLEPGSQGIGGAGSGTAFHYGQNMIVGIQKPVEGSKEQVSFTSDYLTKFEKTVGRQGTATLKANEVWNNSATACKANLGFVLVDSLGNVVYRQWVKKETGYGVAYGEDEVSCAFLIPDNITPGRYTVRPAYQLESEGYASDHFIMFPTGRSDRYTAEVTEKNIVYTTDGAFALTMLDVVTDTDSIVSGVRSKFTVKLRNDGGEFHGPVQLRLFIKGKEKVFGRTDIPKKPIFVSIPANSESEIEFEERIDVPGSSNYVFRLWGNEGMSNEEGNHQAARNLCSKEGFTIIGPALPPVLYVSDDMILTTAKGGVVPRNDVGLKALIENEGGEWTGEVRMAVWDPDVYTRDPLGYIVFDPVTIEGESEQWVNFTGGEFPESAVEGKKYDLTLYDPIENEAMIPSYHVTVQATVGAPVEKVHALTLDDVTFSPEKVMAGEETDVQFTVSNAGFAYNGPLTFEVRRGEDTLHKSKPVNVSIARGETAALVDFTEIFELPTASDYTVALLDSARTEIGTREGLTFTADESHLAVDRLTIAPEPLKSGANATFTYIIKNSGFRFNGNLRLQLLLDGEVKHAFAEKALDVARGAEAEVVFEEKLPALERADSYVARLVDADGNAIDERSQLFIDATDGVEAIENAGSGIVLSGNRLEAAGAEEIAVYSADGSLIVLVRDDTLDLSALEAGVYLVRARFATGSKIVKIVM